jgi:hypothetical protein
MLVVVPEQRFGHELSPPGSVSIFCKRATAMKHFATRFGLQRLYLTTTTKHMHSQSYPVVLHRAEVMTNSLLKSALMVEENMFLPDMENCIGPPPPNVKTIGNVDTGKVYHSAHAELFTKPNDVLGPLMMYLDCICIDQHSRCSLEPGYVTLGIWKLLQETR